MNDFWFKFIIIYVGFMVNFGLFYLTNKFYCWKNKGNCSKCNDWDCLKGYYEEKRKKNIEGS